MPHSKPLNARRSGINNLRIRFNGVFGYFIEVSKANAARVPVEYERRQTLANAERFTTPELRDWEKKVLGAEERIIQLETELFTDVCRQIAAETKRIQMTARALAALDVLASSAETSARRRYATACAARWRRARDHPGTASGD